MYFTSILIKYLDHIHSVLKKRDYFIYYSFSNLKEKCTFNALSLKNIKNKSHTLYIEVRLKTCCFSYILSIFVNFKSTSILVKLKIFLN